MNPQKLVLRLLPAHPSSAHFSLSSQTSRDSGEVLLLSLALGGWWGEKLQRRMEVEPGRGPTQPQALEVAAKGRGPQEQDASVRPQEAPASRKSQEQTVQGGWLG